MIAATGWLAPLFLLHYAHVVPMWPGLLWLWLAAALALGIANWRVIPVPVFIYPLAALFLSASLVLPYLADRLLAPSLPGFLSTLVFPLAWTAVEYLGARLSPFGTWGSLAYTQAGNWPLLQLASVVGVWGIVFVLAWFASVANWLWEGGFSNEAAGAGLAVCWGWSAVVDTCGRELACLDHFAVSERVLIAEVSIAGPRTLYARIGDAWAWSCVSGLVVVAVWASLLAP